MNTQQSIKKAIIGSACAVSIFGSGLVNAHGDEDYDYPFEHPTLEAEQVLDSKHFRIHYTLKGENAVDSRDINGNDIPDYVEDVSKYAEMVRAMQIARGWAAPPGDGNWGGNNLYDIYLVAEAQGGGFADGGAPETTVGDNPGTPDVKETNASFSYIAVGTGYEDSNLEKSRDYLKVLLAHEYHHAIQFGYDGTEPLDWLWEAGASWMEEQLFDDVNSSHEMLNSVFKSTDSCQVSYGGETRMEDDGRWYGLWVFLQFISETHGHDAVKAIWEEARAKDAYDALEAALERYGTDLETTFKDYSVALLIRNFEEGNTFPTVRLEASFNDSGFTATDGVGQMAADYLELDLKGNKNVALEARNLNGMVVGIQAGQASVFELRDNDVSLKADTFDRLYLIVMNLERNVDEMSCASESYSVSIKNTNGHADKANQTRSASNFEAPIVEAIAELPEDWNDWQDSEDYADFDEGYGGDYESITPPAHLIPAYLPEQLELVDAFIDSYEGVEGTVVFFMHPVRDDIFLDVYASEASAISLDSVLNDWGYSDAEKNIEQVANQAVQFEQFEVAGETYVYAIFIKKGEVIEVSSNLPEDELRKVVESLI